MSRTHVITTWDPEDAARWQRDGRRIATRNMRTSVFCVWSRLAAAS
jgi:hypothetical protein